MSNKVNLGGKRLGSGNKMTVQMRNFGRSSHDQGFVFTTDQAFGTLVPALCQIGTRGDTFYLDDITSLVRTLPTNGPVFGSVKQQIDVFVAPIRLYIGALHNNMTGVGLKMDQIKMPQKQHKATYLNSDRKLKAPNRGSVSKTSLTAYLGMNASPMDIEEVFGKYNKCALFELMYWDIYKNYYANKQEEEGVVIGYSKTGVISSNDIDYFYIDTPGGSKVEIGPNSTSWVVDSTISSQEYFLQPNENITIRFNKVIPEEDIMNMEFGFRFGNDGAQPEFFRIRWMVAYGGWEQPVITHGVNTTFTMTYNGIQDPIAGNGSWWIRTGDPAFKSGGFLADYDLIRFPLANIDKEREEILAAPIGTPYIINGDNNSGRLPYTVTTEFNANTEREAMSQEMCGLAVKTHLSDIFNNWLQTDWLDGENGVNELTSVSIEDGKFTMDELNFKQKLFNMMNRIAVQDGSYDAWQTAVYGATGPMVSESPIYVGGYSCEIAFDEVVSSAATDTEPLGSLAGRGASQPNTRKGGRNIKIKCTEASLIMVINSFTPRCTYSQGNEWWTELKSMDDLHKPDLDGIAFQALPSGWMLGSMESFSSINKTGITSPAIGKQPSWVEYTTAVNKTFGSFAAGGELEHLVFNRSYQMTEKGTPEIENATTYIDPREFNIVFADTSLTAKPFWVQIGFNLTSRRVMSASQMPIM